jgi:curli production assembly/transport component CsgE
MFGWLFVATSSLAADDDGPIDSGTHVELSGSALEEATGFIVDRTITNFGAMFVREFAQAWRTQIVTGGVDLTIVEKPSARWGSTIFVEHNNHPVARVFLQAGRSATIKPLAMDTARYMAGRVADNALLNMLMADPDLAPEELP